MSRNSAPISIDTSKDPPPPPLVLPVTVTADNEPMPPGSDTAPLTAPSVSLTPPSLIVRRTHQSPGCRPLRYSLLVGGGQKPSVPGADTRRLSLSSKNVRHLFSAGSYLRYTGW